MAKGICTAKIAEGRGKTHMVSKAAKESARYKTTMSALPIQVMMVALFYVTGWFTYTLYQKKKLPGQR